VRTSYSAEEQCIFVITIIIITINNHQQHYSPWLALASVFSVLYSSLQPLTPIITKFITMLSSHPVRRRPFLLHKLSPSALF
jgi:hypothetical protein